MLQREALELRFDVAHQPRHVEQARAAAVFGELAFVRRHARRVGPQLHGEPLVFGE